MTTKMPGIERFSFNQSFIPGFLIFMIFVPIFSRLVLPLVDLVWLHPRRFPPEANEGWDYWSKATTTMEPYMKEVQFFKQFNVAWIFCWEFRLHQYLPAPYPLSLVWYGSIKLNGGRNTKQSYVAERTWSTFAKQIPKNSRSIIYSILISQHGLWLRRPRKKAHHPPPNPEQEDYHKRNGIS